MSSNTTIFSRPTTVILRILCGSSQERCMCAVFPPGNRRRRHDALHRRGGKQVVERGRDLGVRVPRREAGTKLVVEIAQPRERTELGEVAGEIRAPVAEPDDPDHSLKTLSDAVPFAPV